MVGGIDIAEPTATPAKTETRPQQNVSLDRVAEKRIEAANANKKKKRAAHRVALRRSHTRG
jgi:hypothetical protein